MKVHEILAETIITENPLWQRLFGQGIQGMSSQGVKFVTQSLSKQYADELVKAYQLGLTAKPMTAAYAEKYFMKQGVTKSIAKRLAKNDKILQTAADDAQRILKSTRKQIGRVQLSARASKIFDRYKLVFAGLIGWETMVVPTQQLLAKLDEQYARYEKGEIDLKTYQSLRQGLATIYVGQIASGLGVLLAGRLGQVGLQKIVKILPDFMSKPLQIAIRGATDAALLHFQMNYLNTPEGRKAIGEFMLAGSIFGFPIGGAMQQSVGAAAVEAGSWFQKALEKSIEAVNKVPGVNIKTKPGVPTPSAADGTADTTPATPLVTPRTSFSSWGKPIPPQQ
jgi:hypothetical protein